MIVQSFTGKEINIVEYTVEDVDFFDICHRLSKECRWGAGCRQFYSVAAHCLWVGKITRELGGRMLDGLLYDCHEAYLKDLPGPMKAHMPLWYHMCCNQIDFAIYERLNITPPDNNQRQALTLNALD